MIVNKAIKKDVILECLYTCG